MANGFGSLYIGVAGLQSAQNALNITANNLSNVDTPGYVRQQVFFADRDYVRFGATAAISKQQSGLGVSIGEVVHSRDIFLDRSYRTQQGRYGFYAATYEATSEVETYFQELEGQTFQGALQDFWESFQEFYKAPDDNVYQNLVVQKAQLFISRANAIYAGLESYQYNINTQISDDIDQVNDLGKLINELNLEIQKIEAGNIEKAMTLRDARDQALDELSNLVEISYHETEDGVVKVSIEGVEFVDEVNVYKIEKRTDKATGFITPYWKHLSDLRKGKYADVFEFRTDISAANKNDMGELKALILARGDYKANYTDIVGVSQKKYNNTIGMSVMLKAEAGLDQLIHGIVTALNDMFCPNVEAKGLIDQLTNGGTSLTVTLADGTTRQIDADTKILDTDKCATGIDRQLPPQELFVRIGTERYTKATYALTNPDGTPMVDEDGNQMYQDIYIYNEEDPIDESKQYTTKSLSVNEALLVQESLIPHLMKNGDVDYAMATRLAQLWDADMMTLNPNDTKPYSFKDYYRAMQGEFATEGEVFGSTAYSLSGSVAALDNSRQQVIGVSSDEELTYMIKYQNAYNAASRFINVINEMIEHLLTRLG